MPTVQDSETMALLCALITAEAPLQVGYNCKLVGDTWQAGEAHATRPAAPLADLWRGTSPCSHIRPCVDGGQEEGLAGNEIADLAAKWALRAWADQAAFSEGVLGVAAVRCGYCVCRYVCRHDGIAAFGRGCQSCGVRKKGGSPTKTTSCEQCKQRHQNGSHLLSLWCQLM